MEATRVLHGLKEVFPQVNLSTLVEVSIKFKNDVEAAAEHIFENILPNMVPHPRYPNQEDLFRYGHQQASEDRSNNLQLDPVDKSSNSDMAVRAKQVMSTELSSDVSTSGGRHISEVLAYELLADSQHSSGANSEISASEVDMSLHDDGSPEDIMRSNYCDDQRELLEGAIADEQHKKVILMSHAAAISEMLQEVQLNEERTKHAIAAANKAGNDVLQKVDEIGENTALVMEATEKVAGEIVAERCLLATEAQQLQTRLFSISEETKQFELTIEQMYQTLQRRLAACEVERVAAENAKSEREVWARKALREQELSLEAANQKFRLLKQQELENAKLKELLVDRGHAVDALHVEMLGIFNSITELKQKVDMKSPADEPLEKASPTISLPGSDSAVFHQCPCPAADEPLEDDVKTIDAIISDDDGWDLVEDEVPVPPSPARSALMVL